MTSTKRLNYSTQEPLNKLPLMSKKKVSKRVYKRRVKACAKSPTLEDIVTAAHKAGAKVTVSLVPLKPERPRLELKPGEWPGWAGNRSIIASMEYSDKDVEKVFKENPSSLWIITPFEIIERKVFFAPKPAPEPVAQSEQQSTSNPS